jgi:hypothetical protein
VAPGTPGSIAPEPESKAPSKKESKRSISAAAKLAEASSTASANQTLSALMGGLGGKKKKGKTYSWMTAGSGASTPKANSQDSSAAVGTPGSRMSEKTRLTADGRYRLGTWREDGDKGKNIQLRDWITVLELDGLEVRAIQEAYTKLDASNPK